MRTAPARWTAPPGASRPGQSSAAFPATAAGPVRSSSRRADLLATAAGPVRPGQSSAACPATAGPDPTCGRHPGGAPRPAIGRSSPCRTHPRRCRRERCNPPFQARLSALPRARRRDRHRQCRRRGAKRQRPGGTCPAGVSAGSRFRLPQEPVTSLAAPPRWGAGQHLLPPAQCLHPLSPAPRHRSAAP